MTAKGGIAGPTRFEFADDFSAPGDAGQAGLARDAVISERESAAYARGHNDGAAAERAGVAARALAALERIGERLEAMESGFAALGERSALDARRLALAFARKLAGRLVETDPVAPVEEAFSALLLDLRGQTELAIFLNPDVIAEAEARLQPEIAAKLTNCRVAFKPDDTIAPGDCRIEWPDGGLFRDQHALEARLGELVESTIAASQYKDDEP